MATWILLRGLTRESGHWGEFPAQLARHLPDARILTLDLPGNGALHREASPLRVASMVVACRTQLAALGIDGPVHLLAMSLGAMVALAWAAAHPAQVAGCVLINTSFAGISPFYRRLRPTSYPTLLGVLARADAHAREAAILRLTSRRADPAVLDAWVALRQRHPVTPRNALRQLAAAARFRLPQQRPAVPLLLLSGAGDALVDPRCSADLAAHWQLPHVQHPGAGHDLPLDDGPWLAERIATWLAGDDGAAREQAASAASLAIAHRE
ncbi:2-succinyl-6-hydroxy-2,4-cyclohexadiene-1-carboxylate synthase [compost metagenome]